MLVRTLFVLALFAVVAETIVHGTHALARVTLRRQAQIAVQTEIAAAAAAARGAVYAALAAGGDPHALSPVAPSPQPVCRLAVKSGCALQATATIAFVQGVPASPPPCPQSGCPAYEQGNDAVDEGRIDAVISASALDPDGAVLAARAARVSLRTLRVPPYVTIAGSMDASNAPLADDGAGDDGGTVPAGTGAGSLVDVIYENQKTGAVLPANVWQARPQPADPAAPGWSP